MKWKAKGTVESFVEKALRALSGLSALWITVYRMSTLGKVCATSHHFQLFAFSITCTTVFELFQSVKHV